MRAQTAKEIPIATIATDNRNLVSRDFVDASPGANGGLFVVYPEDVVDMSPHPFRTRHSGTLFVPPFS